MGNKKIDENKISEILELNKKELESFEKQKQENLQDNITKEEDITSKENQTIKEIENKELLKSQKESKKSKYYEDLEKEAEKYLYNSQMPESSTNFLKNIHKPLLKILFVFFLSLFIVKAISSQQIVTNPELTGLWLDEYDNYYEIYDNTFEMNVGDPTKPFYIGDIKNIIKTEKGFIVLTKGIRYEVDINGEYTYKGEEELIFTIKEYKENLQEIMIANIGTNDYKISKVENTPKTQRELSYD